MNHLYQLDSLENCHTIVGIKYFKAILIYLELCKPVYVLPSHLNGNMHGFPGLGPPTVWHDLGIGWGLEITFALSQCISTDAPCPAAH